MDFTLKLRHHNISDECLIADMQRVAQALHKDSLTYSEYDTIGEYDSSTIRRRFGSWKLALDKANLQYTRKSCKTHEFCISDEDFILDVRYVAKQLNKDSITFGEYQKYGKYPISKRAKRIGGWSCVLNQAQLNPTPYKLGRGKNILNRDLLSDIESMWIKLGRQPTTNDVKSGLSKYSLNTYARRFGSWTGALKTFIEYVNGDVAYVEDDLKVDKSSQNKILPLTSSTNNQFIQPHRTKREPSNRLKVQVLMRDGNRCRLCGVECNDGLHNIHFDHIIPWSKGGETVLENLQVLCSDCNLAKGNID